MISISRSQANYAPKHPIEKLEDCKLETFNGFSPEEAAYFYNDDSYNHIPSTQRTLDNIPVDSFFGKILTKLQGVLDELDLEADSNKYFLLRYASIVGYGLTFLSSIGMETLAFTSAKLQSAIAGLVGCFGGDANKANSSKCLTAACALTTAPFAVVTTALFSPILLAFVVGGFIHAGVAGACQ